MLVTCQYCHNKVEKDTAYRYTDTKNKNYYFCNENHFKLACAKKEKAKREKAEYDKIYELSSQIFGYTIGSYALLKGQIQLVEKTATRQKIIEYLTGEEEFLADAMRKEFDDEFSRVRYFKAIISSKIHDWKPRPKINIPEKRIEVCGVDQSNYKPAESRRGLAFLEED